MAQPFNTVFQNLNSIVDVIFTFAFYLVCLAYYKPDPEKHYSSSARYVRAKVFTKSVKTGCLNSFLQRNWGI